MRSLAAALLVTGIAITSVRGADDTLDEKFVVGKWSLVYIGSKENGKFPRSIEFKADGTYTKDFNKMKSEGKYVLKGASIELTQTTPKALFPVEYYSDLTIKDGKMVSPPLPMSVPNGLIMEFTRVEKKGK
jgi:hypothetical protein